MRAWRRLWAWDLHEAGWSRKPIATAVDASEAAASTWLKRTRTGGVEALKRLSPWGAMAKLTTEQRARLPAILAKGAEHYGFIGDVWTTMRVAVAIRRVFGVSCPPPT